MSEAEVPDDTVDVLCVGTGPGSLAYAIHCAANDLDVVLVERSGLDPPALAYLSIMTQDLQGSPPDLHLAVGRLEPAPPPPSGRRATVEPFVGPLLRAWSARCLASPFGVMFTEVPDLAPMITGDGESVTAAVIGDFRPAAEPPGPALSRWLRDQADEYGLFDGPHATLAGLIVEGGRVAGAVLETADGPWRVNAAAGLALSVGTAPQQWPAQPELAGVSAAVAVVGRRAGRFARVELVPGD